MQVLSPKPGRQQIKNAEFDPSTIQRLKDCAYGRPRGVLIQSHHWEFVLFDRSHPLLIEPGESSLQVEQLAHVCSAVLQHFSYPTAKPAVLEQPPKRKHKGGALLSKGALLALPLISPHIKNAVFQVLLAFQTRQVQIVSVFSNSIECLIQRRKPLLPIQNQVGWSPVLCEGGSALYRSRLGQQVVAILF